MPEPGFLARAGELLGFSKFWRKNGPLPGMSIDSDVVNTIRSFLGGNLQRPPVTQTEWLMEDVDRATNLADQGDLMLLGGLYRAMKRDLLIAGLQRTKSGGITRLPKEWFGSQRVIEDLTETDHGIARFDLLAPPQQLRKMAEDADMLGVAYGELVPVEGRDYPVLERKDPENLFYLWPWNLWVFRSTAGIIPIIPGDGRSVLHIASGGLCPWQDGMAHSVGRSWVRKDSAQHLFDNWTFHLANPARIAMSPQGSTPTQRLNWFQQVAQWGINSVFECIPGWEVKVLETNGRGWEGFEALIKLASEEIMIGLAGQLVSITGGTGFSDQNMYETIRFDLIEETAVPLSHTSNTQILPIYTYNRFPEEFDDCPGYKYKVERPSDLSKEASVYTAIGSGIQQLQEAAQRSGLKLDIRAIFGRYGLSVYDYDYESENRGVKLAQLAECSLDIAQCITIDEARQSQGLGPIGDKRGKMTIQELTNSLKQQETMQQLPQPNAAYRGGPYRASRVQYPQTDVEIPTHKIQLELWSRADDPKWEEDKHPRREPEKKSGKARSHLRSVARSHTHNFRATHEGEVLAMRAAAPTDTFEIPEPMVVESAGDVAILSIQGALEHHGCTCQECASVPFHTYDLLLDSAQHAFASEAKVLVIRCTSPGGEVNGCFEASRELRRMSDASGKPIVWFIDGESCSAAYALACAANYICVPKEAGGASIGVYFEYKSEARKIADEGIDAELVRSGEHKADGHPFLPITDEAREEIQRRVNDQASVFFDWVSERRGIDVETVKGFEGRVYLGEQLVGLKLADRVCDYSEALELAFTLAASSGEEQT